MKRPSLSIKDLLIYFVLIFISALLIFIGNRYVEGDGDFFIGQDLGIEKAEVTDIISVKEEAALSDTATGKNVTVLFQSRFTNGDRAGETVSTTQHIMESMENHYSQVKTGDKIYIFQGASRIDGVSWVFYEFQRFNTIIILILIFFFFLLLFGGTKGFNTIVTLALTVMSVFFVFLPSVINGHNIYLWSIITCIYTIVMTFLIINRFSIKNLVSILGCIGGILVAGMMTLTMNKILMISGLVDDSAHYLTMLPNVQIDLRGVVFASIIIGAMGAVMDVAMSVASALYEVKVTGKENVGFAQLVGSGFAIGRDMMGTMTNTLILAYIGGSMAQILLMMVHSGSLESLLNQELIIVESLQALIGSFGILFAIPLTTFISAFFYRDMKTTNDRITE